MIEAVLSDRVRLERLVWVGPLAVAGVAVVRFGAAIDRVEGGSPHPLPHHRTCGPRVRRFTR